MLILISKLSQKVAYLFCRLLELSDTNLMLKYTIKVDPLEAEAYAQKHNMGFYEISPLVNFNITESFQVILINDIRNLIFHHLKPFFQIMNY